MTTIIPKINRINQLFLEIIQFIDFSDLIEQELNQKQEFSWTWDLYIKSPEISSFILDYFLENQMNFLFKK